LQSVAGRLRAGEAAKTARAVGARQRGSVILFYLAIVTLIVGGAVLGYWAGVGVMALTHWYADVWLFEFGGMVLGWLAYVKGCRPLLIHRFKRKMDQRGLPTEMDMSFDVGPVGFKSTVGAVSKTADWNAVTDVFENHGYWIFLVQMDAWFVPRRYFESPESEKAFLRECLSHMTEAARGRSVKVVSFANG
jgi:hypothetical protein